MAKKPIREIRRSSHLPQWFGRALIVFILVLPSCSSATAQAIAAGLAAAGGSASTAPTSRNVRSSSGSKLMLFGGQGHKVYLGCLNCSQYATDSVLNMYGSHGSPYGTESIFNKYSNFGSRYSTYSACNPYATDPPVIVDENGNYYGRLTVNRYNGQGANSELLAWIAGVCQN
jgi:hypothetical protein